MLDNEEESVVMRILLALLLAFLLACVALAVDAQELPRPTATRTVHWYLFRGYVLDAATNQVQGSYTVTRVPGDRQSRDGFYIITIGGQDSLWIVIVIPGNGERPKWQTAPATGLLGFTRWWPQGGVMEVGDVRWALAVRGTLEEVP